MNSEKASAGNYSAEKTERSERVLVTVLGDIGPWSAEVYLAGGLVPRYLVPELPEDVQPHVGSSDVDLVISIALPGEDSEAYRTLHKNIKDAGFEKGDSSFRWRRKIDDSIVLLEFLCETDAGGHGKVFKPKKQGLGAKLGALNVRGADLAAQDFITVAIDAERLDEGGLSTVEVQVANVLPFVVLKVFAFQDRHANKDSYDLVFTLRNWPGGPADAGRAARESPVAADPTTADAVRLLGQRYAGADLDGPVADANFLAGIETRSEAQLRQEAVTVMRQFLAGFRSGD